MVTRTNFRLGIKNALDNASITFDGDSVPIRASHNDEDVTQRGSPFITIEKTDKSDNFNRHGSNYTEQEMAQQIYVFAADSVPCDEVTEDVVDALPQRIDDATIDSIDVSPAFSPSQNIKMHSNTVSVVYDRK